MFTINPRIIHTLVFIGICYLVWFVLLRRDNDGVEQLVRASDFQADYNVRSLWDNRRRVVELLVEQLPKFTHNVQDCRKYINGNETEFRWAAAKKWQFMEDEFMIKKAGHDQKCSSIVSTFGFNEQPISDEESAYLLAFAITHLGNSTAQLYYTLSTLYHPQNMHCIAVESNSSVIEQVKKLAECLPNVEVIEIPQLITCKNGALNAEYQCFRQMTLSNHTWKYFQHIYSNELPLKTNLEMVRIFRQLNGLSIVDVMSSRVEAKSSDTQILPLWRSSTTPIVSRESAEYALKNQRVNKTVEFLMNGHFDECVEELLWASMFGNKKDLSKMPGAFNAASIVQKLVDNKAEKLTTHFKPTSEEPFQLLNWRLGVFEYTNGQKCSDNCSFKLLDLKSLVERHELFARKFELNSEPSAYFCLHNVVRNRTLNIEEQWKFKGDEYQKLPNVRLAHGETIQNIEFNVE